MYDELIKTLHQLVDDHDWCNLASIANALDTGEWDEITELEQREWLDNLK